MKIQIFFKTLCWSHQTWLLAGAGVARERAQEGSWDVAAGHSLDLDGGYMNLHMIKLYGA